MRRFRWTAWIVVAVAAAAVWLATRCAPDENVGLMHSRGLEAPPESRPQPRPVDGQLTAPIRVLPTPLPNEGAQLVVSGRVVDRSRRPVAGAPIRLLSDAQTLGETVSARDGSFEIVADAAATVDAAATTMLQAGNRATGSAWVTIERSHPTGEDGCQDVGVVALVTPLVPTRLVVLRDGGPIRSATVHVDATAQGTTGQDGVHVCDLAEGVHRVAAYSDRSGWGMVSIIVSAPTPIATPITIPIEPTVPIAVQVVESRSATPVVGARVEVLWPDPGEVPMLMGEDGSDDVSTQNLSRTWMTLRRLRALGFPSPPVTDANGRTQIVGPLTHTPILVRASTPSDVRLEPRARLVPMPATTPVRIELDSTGSDASTVWPIDARSPEVLLKDAPCLVVVANKDGVIPRFAWPDATTSRDRAAQPAAPAALIRDGALRWRPPVHGAGSRVDDVVGRALTRDGRVANLTGPDAQGLRPAIHFEPSHRVTVRVASFPRDAAIPITVSMTEVSTNLRCERQLGPDATAVFTDLPAGAHRIALSSGRRGLTQWLRGGSFAIEAPDGTLTLTPGEELTARFRVTVDGKPAIPHSLELAVGGDAVITAWAEDPGLGELTLRMLGAPGSYSFRFSDPTSGFRQDVTPTLPSREPTQVGIWATTSLTVHVIEPRSTAVPLSPRIEFLDDSHESEWLRQRDSTKPRTATTVVRTGLRPGRYRVHYDEIGIATDVLVISESNPQVEATLDLSSAFQQAIRVRVPGDWAEFPLSPPLLDVSHRGDSRSFSELHQSPTSGGPPEFSFRQWFPGTTPVTVTAHHPLLRPATSSGTATITTPVEKCVLEMEWDRRAYVRFVPPLVATDPRVVGYVLAHREASSEDVSDRWDLYRVGDRAWFGGFDPAARSLTFVVAGRPPIRLNGVDLTGSDDVDLGTVASTERCGTIRLQVSVRPKNLPGDLFVRLIPRDRRLEAVEWRIGADQSDAEITGLAPGTWHVYVVPGGTWIDTCRPEDKVDTHVTIRDGAESLVVYPR